MNKIQLTINKVIDFLGRPIYDLLDGFFIRYQMYSEIEVLWAEIIEGLQEIDKHMDKLERSINETP